MATFSPRKTLLNIHLYSGLLCFSYLLIFGISSLNFNHPSSLTQAPGTPVTWKQSVDLSGLPRVPASASAAERNALKVQANGQVSAALGLFGYTIPYTSGWKDADTYHASLSRPGKRYEVDVHVGDKVAVVTETPTGLWNVIRQLHGLSGKIPGSAFVGTWGWYTELCTFTVLFSALSGIYLWTRRKNERRLGLMMLASAVGVSLAAILYITFHG